MELKINEALARAEELGNKVTKKQLAAKLWPDSPQDSREVLMTKLCKGEKKLVAPEWIISICETLNCTPNYLFDYEAEN